MSVARRSLFVVICAVCCGWAALVFQAQTTRLDAQELLGALRQNKDLPEYPKLSDAIVAYRSATRLRPCDAALTRDLTLLHARASEEALFNADLDASDRALDDAQQTLERQLTCAPLDGKAWFDLAMLNAHREGITVRTLAAYRMSAQVAPGESWLAQKRLQFAITFRPLLDEAALDVVKRDLAVLALAHPMRLDAVMKATQLKSKDELHALFATAATP